MGRSIRDICAGLIFLGFGLAFGFAASGYQLGTALRMGPGYFPLLLAGVLSLVGVGILVNALRGRGEAGSFGVVPWRAALLVLGAILFFGASVRGLGLAPTLFLTAFAAALASPENTPTRAATIALALTVFCVAIFSYGLGVTVPLLGTWVR
jgi:hypothetical protein